MKQINNRKTGNQKNSGRNKPNKKVHHSISTILKL